MIVPLYWRQCDENLIELLGNGKALMPIRSRKTETSLEMLHDEIKT